MAMEIATVNEGLHYGLVFDVIKYLAIHNRSHP
jgi:hypothetical protein